jgi:signal transduction histidine kinase
MNLNNHSEEVTDHLRLALRRLSASLQSADDEAEIVALLDKVLSGLQVRGWLYRTLDSGQLQRLLPPRDPLGREAQAFTRETSLTGACQPVLVRLGERQETIYAQDGSSDWDLLCSLTPPDGVRPRRKRQLRPDSGIGVPIIARGRTIGLLIVFGVGLQPAEAAEYRFLADRLARALEHAFLSSDLKQALVREQAAANELRHLEELIAELSAGRDSSAHGRSLEQVTTASQTEMLIQLGRTLPHQLSQPLSIISGYAELIAAGRLKDQALQDACHELVEASCRLADLVQRLLSVTSHARNDFEGGSDTSNFERPDD